MSSNNRTMGDFFQQQQQQQQQQQPPRRGGGGHAHSRSPHSSNNSNNNNRGGRNNRHQQQRQQQQQKNYKDLPLEQGVICTLRDSFGFIHCADRPEEIFFHYSQVLPSTVAAAATNSTNSTSTSTSTTHPADALQMDQEVEFRVGTSARDADKLAAFQVRALEPGTIVWETVQEQQVQGVVERTCARADGTIRRVIHDNDDDKTDQNNDNDNINKTDPTDDAVVIAKFGPNDYVPPLRGAAGRNTSNRLGRGDLVQFTLVMDRRTKEHYARKIVLILSEKERLRQEEEKRMLAEATLEHGVITSLKGDYGFLRSNKRREEVYFHYSNIKVEDTTADGAAASTSADGAGAEAQQAEKGNGDTFKGKEDEEPDMVLKEGQDMKFLVVTEGGGSGGDRPRRRISARHVVMQPRGSVQFHDVLATGVTGIVSLVPQPQDSGHALETKGKVRLTVPLKDSNLDGSNERLVTEVYLSSKDSPGGSFDFRGGSSVGLWIEVGDTILFDVVKDFADGACRAVPTKQKDPCDNPTDPDNIAANGHEDGEDQTGQAIRLLRLALPMRSEGIVNALKDTYGFIHFAERPVDAHFKLFQLLPDELQNDLRRSMGLANTDSHGKPLRLALDAEVQYDMSVHGSIQSHSTRQRNHNKERLHERENLKAQRVLLLPPGTIVQSRELAHRCRGVITKDNPKQPYSGTVELDKNVEPMSLEDRHPLVAQMIDDLLASEDGTKIVYHDLQSMKEDDVVVEMIKKRGAGQLTWRHIPQAGESTYPGRLCIEKVSAESKLVPDIDDQQHKDSDDGDDGFETGSKDDLSVDTLGMDDDKPARSHRKRKQKASKPLKTIRFDKSNLVRELKEDLPPGVGDIVELDVSQSRRTGQFHAEKLTMVKRHTPEVDATGSSGVGVVKEVVAARRFGFISVIDETASSLEMLFFNLSSVVSQGADTSPSKKKSPGIRKGDEVKFTVGTEKSGKRVALNVTVLAPGTIPNEADKNACRGLVLMEPSHTSLKNTPLRHTKSNISQTSEKSGRWDSVDGDRSKPVSDAPATERGCVLLLEDPTGMFTSRPSAAKLEPADNISEISAGSSEDAVVALKSHLRYKNGAIAVHGSGASSATDESSKPRRGDIVSFVKTRKSGNDLRDIRIVKRGAATLIRGQLENISPPTGDSTEGSAKFVAKEGGKTYDISLSEIVSCEPGVLKEKEAVEGILHEGSIYGVCRTVDLYLESKLGASHKQRPKLNLTVKKDRGGKIMAQSMMAKGPEQGTNGFAPGWTKRMSAYVTPFVPNS